MTAFTRKIKFSNVRIAYGGCDCCGDRDVYHVEPGPYIVFVRPDGESIESHAKVAFGDGVVDFDHSVEG